MLSTEKNTLTGFILILMIALGGFTHISKGQKVKTMASNTFNGAMTGGILGGATMALQNSKQLDPVRFGVGLGTLGGLVIGAHDATRTSEGEQYLIDGTFNRGHATTVIILLDSIYGGATGIIVGTAVNLMVEEPIINGVQYGVGAGIWGGFLFGLVDAFYLSSTRSQTITSFNNSQTDHPANWLTYEDRRTRISFLQPQLYSFKKIKNKSINRQTGLSISMVEFSVQL